MAEYEKHGYPLPEKSGLIGICRDRPPYMVRGVSRIGNPTYIWRHTTPIPREPKSAEKVGEWEGQLDEMVSRLYA